MSRPLSLERPNSQKQQQRLLAGHSPRTTSSYELPSRLPGRTWAWEGSCRIRLQQAPQLRIVCSGLPLS